MAGGRFGQAVLTIGWTLLWCGVGGIAWGAAGLAERWLLYRSRLRHALSKQQGTK